MFGANFWSRRQWLFCVLYSLWSCFFFFILNFWSVWLLLHIMLHLFSSSHLIYLSVENNRHRAWTSSPSTLLDIYTQDIRSLTCALRCMDTLAWHRLSPSSKTSNLVTTWKFHLDQCSWHRSVTSEIIHGMYVVWLIKRWITCPYPNLWKDEVFVCRLCVFLRFCNNAFGIMWWYFASC